ncbi:hypothetical protein GRX03_10250 [Halovenus sp. WSH3]|uniref:Uncharacterized protein n=1 Tax=Halovenus carboxidivorans TaxID=2692199 RepID=A0A6B0T194_9EURY|nr:hypothetical protein [Halovenus carboxidivorans]MXR51978.1 hypothetical protein [Halovenus carboxidivorans]
MVSRETIVVLVSGGVGTALAVGIESAGLLGGWTGLLAFIYLGGFWYALPQLALATTSGDGLSTLRVRLIPVILFFLAIAITLSPLASGRELLGIWGIVAVAIGALVGSAFVRGYREGAGGTGE